MTAPHVDGQGEKTAMINALISAGLNIGDIGYISAHGTGTKLNDKTEALAVNSLFVQYNPCLLYTSRCV